MELVASSSSNLAAQRPPHCKLTAAAMGRRTRLRGEGRDDEATGFVVVELRCATPPSLLAVVAMGPVASSLSNVRGEGRDDGACGFVVVEPRCATPPCLWTFVAMGPVVSSSSNVHGEGRDDGACSFIIVDPRCAMPFLL